MDGGVHDGIRRPVQIVTGIGANGETSVSTEEEAEEEEGMHTQNERRKENGRRGGFRNSKMVGRKEGKGDGDTMKMDGGTSIFNLQWN